MKSVYIRLPAIVISVILLSYGAMLSVFSHIGFPASMTPGKPFPYLADKPVGEDGYYMLTVAWNIAEGRGIVYNFDKPTTGVQPLNTFYYAGLAAIIQALGGGKWLFSRCVLFLGVINLILFAHLAARVAVSLSTTSRQLIEAWTYLISFSVALLNFGLFRLFTYGLETGVYLVLIAACMLYSFKVFTKESRPRQGIIFGLLVGLTLLARIDFAIVISVFLLLAMLRGQIKTKLLITASIPAILLVAPWFFYVFVVTRSWMPSSGTAQISFVQSDQFLERIWEMIKSLISHLAPWIYSRPSSVLTLAALVSLLLLVYVVFRNKPIRSLLFEIITGKRFFIEWLSGLMMLVPVYTIFFSAPHFYTRYSAPIQALILPLGALILAMYSKDWSHDAKSYVLRGLLLSFFLWTLLSLHTGFVTNSQGIVAGYIQNRLPPPIKVGVFQSGIAGYFNPNVLNLDGKVNHEVLKYKEEHRVNEYIDDEQILVLVDWEEVIKKNLPEEYLLDWESCPVEVPDGRSICLERK